MTELERAEKALARAKSLLQGHPHLLPATDRGQLADFYERVRSFLASLGPEEPGPQLAAVIADSQQGQALLWEALIALEGRLTASENQLAEPQRDNSKLENQLAELQGDHCKLLLRQMASQTENKVARVTTPDLTPKLAVHMSFNRLSNGGGKQFNQAAFEQVVNQYPGLQAGLEALKELGTVVAHLEMARLSDGSRQLVTSEVLKDLIDKEYPDGDPVKSDVEAVHTCLADLARQLNEDIFVPTM